MPNKQRAMVRMDDGGMHEFRLKISLKFVPKGPMNNIPALVQIMAWCRPGDRTLSASVMGSCLTHIYVIRLQ